MLSRYIIVSLLLATPLLTGCQNQAQPGVPATQLAKDGEMTSLTSYAMGLAIGRRLRVGFSEDGITADNDRIVSGVRDGLTGRKPQHSGDQLEDAVAMVEREVQLRIARKRYASDPSFKKMADENLAQAREQLEALSRRAGVEKDPNGILTQTLIEGTGDYVAGASHITVNAVMTTGDLVKVRQTEEGKPTEISLARLKPQVADVLRERRIGGKYRLAVPPELGFGLAGNPPTIGPNQAIVLQFEIVSAR
jgi:FKBP-type peptidyl-prolyl cis-trans isomerase